MTLIFSRLIAMAQLNLLDGVGPSDSITTDIYDYRPRIFSKAESELLRTKIIADTSWVQRRVMMYGKEVITPRLTAWHGDIAGGRQAEDKTFMHAWTPELLVIREKVQKLAGVTFDSVLLNYYRDGNDSVAWHDDQDGRPGKNMLVASVSLGQERRFDIRRKSDHSDKMSVLLEDGSYILMKGRFQDDWEHRIAKSSKPMAARINLTFRITPK